MAYVSLDGYIVVRTTEQAVLLRDRSGRDTWIPRSQCEDGDALDIDDTDICVASWFASREGLAC
jgi:hypothetical protein